MVTLKQLRYFAALARIRHFGRAAAECAVTQPALSMQVRELEMLLGVDLVERRPGDVVLTAVGVEVAKRAEQVLAGARDLVDVARHQGRPLAGPLRLGLIPTLAPYVLPKLLPTLQRSCPDLRLDVRETQTRTLLAELVGGRIDLAMLALPIDGPDVETTPLFDDPFVLAVPADDPRSEAAVLDPTSIETDRLLLLEEGHCLRDQALAVCSAVRRDSARTSVSLGATSLATVMQMVASGYGTTLLPRIAVEIEARDARIKLLRFASPQPGRRVGLACRRTSPRKSDFVALAGLVVDALGVSRASSDDDGRAE